MSTSQLLKTFVLGGVGGAGGILLTKTIWGDFGSNPLTIKPMEDLHKTNPVILEQPKPLPQLTPVQLRSEKILKYGAPTACLPDVLHYQNHVLQYDASRRTPKWVAEHLSQDMVNKQEANRKNAKFKVDPGIPIQFSSTNKDFWNSGWSRGHMAPAGNNKHCQASMNDTFYLTNVVPQDMDNNGNYWNRLEIYCRNLTAKFHDVYVISGPLWLPKVKLPEGETASDGLGDNEPKNSRRDRPPPKIVEYQVIGENNVSVPTHLYKVILVEDPSLEAPLVAGFVVPNAPIEDKHLKEFQVKIGDLEKHAGLKFHSKMEALVAPGDLCEVEGCRMQDYKEFQQFFWKRRLSSPWNLRGLERDWKEATRKRVVTPELEAIYIEKREEMVEKEKVWEEKKRMEKEQSSEIINPEKREGILDKEKELEEKKEIVKEQSSEQQKVAVAA